MGGVSIAWCTGAGEERSATLTRRVFIGRHPNPGHGFDPLSVYALDAETLTVEADLGGPYPTVSRLHTLVEEEPSGALIVRDHGHTGRGSRNGTWVNGARLPTAGKLEVRDGIAVVGLALSGPRLLAWTSSARPGAMVTVLIELADAAGIPPCLVRVMARMARATSAQLVEAASGVGDLYDCIAALQVAERISDVIIALSGSGELDVALNRLKMALGSELVVEVVRKALGSQGADSLLAGVHAGSRGILASLLPRARDTLRDYASRACSGVKVEGVIGIA